MIIIVQAAFMVFSACMGVVRAGDEYEHKSYSTPTTGV